MHIIQSPGVGQIRTNGGVRIIIIAFPIGRIIIIAAQLVHIAVFITVGKIVPIVQSRGRARPASKLPLRFRRKIKTFVCFHTKNAQERSCINFAISRPLRSFIFTANLVI